MSPRSIAALSRSSPNATANAELDMVSRSVLLDQLPPFAREFLDTSSRSLPTLVLFHQWLRHSHRPIVQLDAREVERFLAEMQRSSLPERKRARYRHLALRYFDWLHARGLLRFDPRCAWPRSGFPLPSQARQFLESLQPTHKRSTVRGYQTNLRQFHLWLDAEHVPIETIDRHHVESWLGWLYERGLHPSTRLAVIQHIRAYFDWLAQQGLLAPGSADLLLRSSDLPKLPQYLPRPIPRDIDVVLQQRLQKSRSLYQLGLLLMRRTGLRIGELITLPYDCVQIDPRGQVLLKVPLGKLDTERLVPLDEKTAKLVLKLQRNSRRKHPWLLQTPTGKKTRYELYRQALLDACSDFSLPEPMTTHRLRHTYATTLLAGGMNLPSVMRILGHRDYRMTLRYAAVTDETIAREYAAALEKAESRYSNTSSSAASPPERTLQPERLLLDAARYLERRIHDQSIDPRRAQALMSRLRRLDSAFRTLLRKNAR
jgi:site-specific recombinase XerD